MQQVQLYIGNKKTLSGTVTYSTSNNISDNTKNFYQNDWVVGATIKNVQTGVTATILSIYSQVTITLDISASSFGSGSYEIEKTEYQRLDTYKDETITITQSIKNIKDLAKILTDFSQSFTVPASKNNNKIFKHYYNSNIQNSIDARFLIDAKINLNGIDFKEGKIRVLGVKMKDNSPSSYQITFVGNTVSLKTLFSDDELTELPYLDVFNHTYSYSNIRDYMQDGYNFTGSGNTSNITPDMAYHFISAESRYYYDSGQHSSHPEIENVRNIYNHDPSTTNEHADYHSLSMYDFKPAIKVYYILKAIEDKYGFTFSDDFFDQDSEVFRQLYLWCSRKAGSLVDNIDEESGEVKFEDLIKLTGTEVREDNNTSFTIYRSHPSGGRFTYINLTYQGTVNVTGTGYYDFLLYDKDTNEVFAEFKNETGNQTFDVTITAPRYYGYKTIKPAVKITTKAGITSFSLGNVVLTKESKLDLQDPATITTGNYYSTTVTVSEGLNFRQAFLPKIKVIDFLTGIFKMFNLVAYFEGTELVVKTLDDYYLNSSNAEFDITKYVDMGSSTINRNDVYSEINYEYEKPKTIFAIKSNEATNDEFGNEKFKSEGDNAFDGGKYDVKVKFGHMVYENLIDQDTGDFSNILFGYSVDKDENPVLDAATLFMGIRISLPSDIYFTDKPFGETGQQYTIEEMTHLQIPSNIYATGSFPSIEYHSINFGSEFAPFEGFVLENSLFKDFHQNFIQNIYDPQARILKISAHLPLSILLKYKLNDRFIVGGKKYLINSAKTNLQTGKTELELLTDNYIEE